MTKLLFGSALAALALAIPAAAPAQRLSPAVVAVVDTNRIFSECTACRAAQTQLQAQLTQAQQRATQLRTPLQAEGQAIQTAVNALAGKQPDAALTARAQALQTRQDSANQELAGRENTIRSTQAHVAQQINTRLVPIYNQVLQSRGASLIVEKGATVSVSPSIDVTNDVLTQLNQQLPSVSVTPMPQAQQPAGR